MPIPPSYEQERHDHAKQSLQDLYGKGKDERITVVIQVNGKVRARLELPAGSEKDEVQEAALAEANVQRHIADGTIRKVIHIPDRLLNIVVA